ncbi:hypothetical protein Avbf_09334 [Armadillidium vulgare]|nr:hypothetical protein Avbf_09334 [Armadillidium vulgare]
MNRSFSLKVPYFKTGLVKNGKKTFQINLMSPRRIKLQFSEIPSLLPSDKNITVTLFITLPHFDDSQLDVTCTLEGGGCNIRKDSCAEWEDFELRSFLFFLYCCRYYCLFLSLYQAGLIHCYDI